MKYIRQTILFIMIFSILFGCTNILFTAAESINLYDSLGEYSDCIGVNLYQDRVESQAYSDTKSIKYDIVNELSTFDINLYIKPLIKGDDGCVKVLLGGLYTEVVIAYSLYGVDIFEDNSLICHHNTSYKDSFNKLTLQIDIINSYNNTVSIGINDNSVVSSISTLGNFTDITISSSGANDFILYSTIQDNTNVQDEENIIDEDSNDVEDIDDSIIDDSIIDLEGDTEGSSDTESDEDADEVIGEVIGEDNDDCIGDFIEDNEDDITDSTIDDDSDDSDEIDTSIGDNDILSDQNNNSYITNDDSYVNEHIDNAQSNPINTNTNMSNTVMKLVAIMVGSGIICLLFYAHKKKTID